MTPDVLTQAEHTDETLRIAIRTAYRTIKQSGWALACYCSEVKESGAYARWGFSGMGLWAEHDVPAIAGNISHYCAAGKFLMSLNPDTRAIWCAFPVWNVIAAGPLLQHDPAAVLVQLQSGASSARIRRIAAELVPDQHLESEWRTIKMRVSQPVFALWQQAMYRAAYEACKSTPTPDDLITCVSQALLNEPLDVPRNGLSPEGWHEAIHTGKVRCRECGSQDRRFLDWHHVIARSFGGHEGPQVPLCRDCHQKIQPKWRQWLASQADLEQKYTDLREGEPE